MIYRVTDKTTGLSWEVNGKRRRVNSGETANDFPSDSVPSLLASGLIAEVTFEQDEITTDKLEMEAL